MSAAEVGREVNHDYGICDIDFHECWDSNRCGFDRLVSLLKVQ